jgi:hypothetical protein
MQQRIALAALQMHTSKKERDELQKRKTPLQRSIPCNINTKHHQDITRNPASP